MTLDQRFNQMQEMLREVRQIRDETPNGGGGGGQGNDHLHQRMSRLEGQHDKLLEKVDKVGERVSGLSSEIATLKERVAHLPSKEHMTKTALAIVAGMTVIMTFGDKLQSLIP